MTAYLIKGLAKPSIAVFTYSDFAAATRAAEGRFVEVPTAVAAEANDLATRSGPALVALYNALIDESVKPITKFETRSIGAERVFAVLESRFKNQPVESEAASSKVESAATPETETNEDDMAAKGKKTKKKAAPAAKKVREPKAPRAPKMPKVKKDRKFKDTVASKGGEKSKATALEMISRKMGATASEIADKLELSVGSAKNLVWYLRRDGNKIVVNKDSERKPYVIA